MGIRFDEAILNETVFFDGDAAKLKISYNTAAAVPVTGENQQHVCLIYKTANGRPLNEKNMQIILNLISAIKYSLTDVAIVNAADITGNAFLILKARLSPKIILCFGLKPEDMSLHLNYGKNIPVQFDGMQLLFTDSAEQLDNAAKLLLWAALKKMFPI